MNFATVHSTHMGLPPSCISRLWLRGFCLLREGRTVEHNAHMAFLDRYGPGTLVRNASTEVANARQL